MDRVAEWPFFCRDVICIVSTAIIRKPNIFVMPVEFVLRPALNRPYSNLMEKLATTKTVVSNVTNVSRYAPTFLHQNTMKLAPQKL